MNVAGFDRERIVRLTRRLRLRTFRLLSGSLSGAHAGVDVGRGLDFREVRVYQPGDDVRRIDWKVTARRAQPFVKTFDVERQRTIWLVVDLGPGMRFAGFDVRNKQPAKLQAAIEAAAVLAFAAAGSGDRVGAIAFDGSNLRSIPPRSGLPQAERIVHLLLQVAYGSEPHSSDPMEVDDVVAILESHRTGSGRGIYVIGDLRTFGMHGWRALSRHGRAEALCLIHPQERRLPQLGMVRCQDAVRSVMRVFDTSDPRFRSEYSANFERHRKRIRAESRGSRMHWQDLPADSLTACRVARLIWGRQQSSAVAGGYGADFIGSAREGP